MSNKQIKRKTARNQRSYDWCKRYVTDDLDALQDLIKQCNGSPQIVHKIARKLRGIIIEERRNIAENREFRPGMSTDDQIEHRLYQKLLSILDGVISELSKVHPTIRELSERTDPKHVLHQHIMRRSVKHRLNDAIAMRMMLRYLCGKTHEVE